jgi:hypothetical protein
MRHYSSYISAITARALTGVTRGDEVPNLKTGVLMALRA